ncbi:MAG: helix-turn-helix transcriptional regulator [Williamsia sp.]|nr:helix-turn-helix transcriptional regulator [Williamsia sp.]
MTERTFNHADFYQIIGDKIRLARKERGIDQESLAKCVNLTRTSIINIEKGRQCPSILQIWQMAQYLNVNFTELVPPLNLNQQIDDWSERLKNHSLISDEDSKPLMSFISATRTS